MSDDIIQFSYVFQHVIVPARNDKKAVHLYSIVLLLIFGVLVRI